MYDRNRPIEDIMNDVELPPTPAPIITPPKSIIEKKKPREPKPRNVFDEIALASKKIAQEDMSRKFNLEDDEDDEDG